MISCVSPNAGSCEHTLNTLRYADRVKSLSKSGNPRKDQAVNTLPVTNKDVCSASSWPIPTEVDNTYEQQQELKAMDMARRVLEKESSSCSPPENAKQPLSSNPSLPHNGHEESGLASVSIDRELVETNNSYGGPTSKKTHSSYPQNSTDTQEKVKKVSPPHRKGSREEKPEKLGNWLKKDATVPDLSVTNSRQQSTANHKTNITGPLLYERDPPSDGNINEILEEEEALIAAHRKEIEDTMEIVREEMKLLAEVDQPGSLIDNYVTQLSFVLSRKAAGLVSLQARLARFQHRLKEQEILSRKRVPR
uniref:Kinesin-13A isoform X2 n=1 Tax=Rhizophora mucronata TaxID=61149 RepID=A0A2P2MI53_RHIMU